jgi:hypothetical protein
LLSSDFFLLESFSGLFSVTEESDFFSLSDSLDVPSLFCVSSFVHKSNHLSEVAAVQAATAVQAAGTIHNHAKAFHHNLLQMLSFFFSFVSFSLVSA